MRYLNEQIGEDYKGWGSDEVVLISTPTGSGKTTFVLQQLWSYARERREHMIFISNRKAITRQVKRKILAMYDFPEERMEETEDVCEFDFLTVISYQKMEEKLLRGRFGCIGSVLISEVRYVVCDEAHYVLSDALFNARTGGLNIKLQFGAATRIYMSATLEAVRDYILKKEGIQANSMTEPQQYINILKKEKKVHEFFAPINYKYIRPWFISNLKEIVDAINREWEQGVPDRWLIWVTNKTEGQAIKRSLKCTSCFLMSESSAGMTNESMETWRSISACECFEQKVLLCTKVLDCGVTLRDSLLKNMVVTATDQVEFIQMLGRKRMSDANEQLNLFILPRSKAFFMNQLNFQLKPKREIMRAFRKGGESGLLLWMLENDTDFAKQGTILAKPGMRFVINEATEYVVQKRIDWVYDMLAELEADGDNAFLRRQLDWMGLDLASGSWLRDESRERYEMELREWLEEYENSIFDKSTWNAIKEKMRDFAFQCKGVQMNPEHPKRVPAISKVQQFLLDYGYEVVKAGVGRWKICRKKEN